MLRVMLAVGVISAVTAIDVKPAAAQPYPPMLLRVPFQCQYPPGDPGNTKNCGQTCALMIDAYFDGYRPSGSKITSTNTWMARRFGDSRYKSANGYYTHFYDGRNSLGRMLREYHRLRYSVMRGGNFTSVLYQLRMGRPVIVGVAIRSGRIVTSGGVAHWALAVGYDPRRHQMILHDPGTRGGRYVRMNMRDFEKSWATQGKIYAPVWK